MVEPKFCPENKIEMHRQEIHKGEGRNRMVGINFFCPEDGCNYEIDSK